MKFKTTDQGNSAPKADDGKDGVFPSKQSGKVVKKTGTPGHPVSNQGQSPPRATTKTDGTGMGHEGGDMSSGPSGRVAHGPSFGKKFGTSEMSQAMRRRQKPANPYGAG